MQSLFEVTAVQTGEETVTLKRVQDTDDNLNDRSESIDIAYDPNNVPAVGDRGLVIRLGNGTRFFFKRDVGVRHFFRESALVKSSAPNTTFNYNGNQHTVLNDASNDNNIIYKLGSPILLSHIASDSIICIGTRAPGQPSWITSQTSGNGEAIIFCNPIIQDFDCSAITYNQLAGLSYGPHRYGDWLRFPSDGDSIRAGWWSDFSDTVPNFMVFSAQAFTGGQTVYGLRVRCARGGACTSMSCPLTGNVLASLPNTPVVWIDYH
jgi:hypothetical protein